MQRPCAWSRPDVDAIEEEQRPSGVRVDEPRLLRPSMPGAHSRALLSLN